jgi:ankyrin repeat protein
MRKPARRTRRSRRSTYLLTLGADVNAVSLTGETAMHGAAYANFPKVVKLLDARGAKIDDLEPEEPARLDAAAGGRGASVRELQALV